MVHNEFMVYDVISYNGEASILDIRLHVLNEFVDEFIICEAPITFSGKIKPLYFEAHREYFKEFLPKIKYHIIDTHYSPELVKMAQESPNTMGAAHWKEEFAQKESIHKALTHLKDEDIVYISDCDEIWKPKEIDDKVYKLKQLVYSFFLNNRSSEPWAGTFVAKYKNIKNECLNHLRSNLVLRLNQPETWTNFIDDGGWHFTSMGGLNELRRKLENSYSEEDYWNTEVQKNIEFNFLHGVDPFGRDFKYWTDESQWPKYLVDNRDKYKHLMK